MTTMELLQKARGAKTAMALADTDTKNQALLAMADALEGAREEILADIQKQNLSRYDELVFCGYGEPTFRWDDIAWVCDQLRDAGPVPPVRMDTNGHGNVICGRDITPELKGRIDVVSISLNWSDQAGYDKIVHPDFPQAFQAMQDFTRRAVAAGRPYLIECAIDKDAMVHPMVSAGTPVTDFILD